VAVRALVIAGSPRVGGNSDILAERLVAGLQDGAAVVEFVKARELSVSNCRACYYCSRAGRCITRDDMERLYELLLSCHRVCLVTPIFFCLIPSIAQAIVERTQALWVRRYHRGEDPPELEHPRQGLVIAVGGTRGQNIFAGVRCMARYWLDSAGFREVHVLTYNNVDEKGAIRNHPTALEEVYRTGLELARPEGLAPMAGG